MTVLTRAADPDNLTDEERRLRRLRFLVDTAADDVRHRPLTRDEAETLITRVREQVLDLFPDKGETFDLIYGPRFRRLLAERFGDNDAPDT